MRHLSLLTSLMQLLWDLGFFAAIPGHISMSFPVWLRAGDADEDPMDAEIRKMMEQQHPGTPKNHGTASHDAMSKMLANDQQSNGGS